MKPLLPADFPKVLPLIEQGKIGSHLPLVYSLLEGRQEGRIFVDDPVSPRTALLCPRNGFYFAYGDADTDSLDRFVPELLTEHLVEMSAVYATSGAWEQKLDTLFREKVTRLGYEYPAGREPPDRKGRIPPGLTLAPMTAPVIAKWHPGIIHWVIDIWGGLEGFEARSFGCCLLAEERIVSIAAACGIGRGEAEIEVATAPEFQRRGLATLVCSAFIEQCLVRGLRPTWSCDARNTPSVDLGAKLGFVELEEIHGYPLDASFQFRDGAWAPPPPP